MAAIISTDRLREIDAEVDEIEAVIDRAAQFYLVARDRHGEAREQAQWEVEELLDYSGRRLPALKREVG
jgi:hypothetical protein